MPRADFRNTRRRKSDGLLADAANKDKASSHNSELVPTEQYKSSPIFAQIHSLPFVVMKRDRRQSWGSDVLTLGTHHDTFICDLRLERGEE